jgi:putative ABC transport system permease protein
MWRTAMRDLQWRSRRVVIAVLGAAVVFAMTLILAGLSSSFSAEAGRTVRGLGADTWVVRAGVYGPFTSVSVLPLADVLVVRSMPGVQEADPVLFLHETVALPRVAEVNLVGYQPGGVGQPRVRHGRLPQHRGELVVDSSLAGVALGRKLAVAGSTYTVVGTTSGMRINAGQPLMFAQLDDVEQAAFPGARIASAVLVRGTPHALPTGLAARTPQQTRDDTLRPVAAAVRSLRTTELLMLLVAGLVIGSAVYLSSLERARDFAVFKATGASSSSLFAGLAGQAAGLALAAAAVGVVLARVLTPAFPLTFTIPLSATVTLPVIAVGVGLAASLAAVRRALRVDPAIAFAGP